MLTPSSMEYSSSCVAKNDCIIGELVDECCKAKAGLGFAIP